MALNWSIVLHGEVHAIIVRLVGEYLEFGAQIRSDEFQLFISLLDGQLALSLFKEERE